MKSTERIVQDLQRDSEEVSRALDEFMRQRSDVSAAHKRAEEIYESTLLDIGEVYDRSRTPSPIRGVMHADFRHVNKVIDVEGEDNYEDDFGGDESYYTVNSRFAQTVATVEPKRAPPSDTEKAELREEIISFFDDSRKEEIDLERRLEELPEDDPEAKKLSRALYEVQKKNYSILLQFLAEYQPMPFNKAWGNDPEYHALTKSFDRIKKPPGFRNSVARLKHQQSQGSEVGEKTSSKEGRRKR